MATWLNACRPLFRRGAVREDRHENPHEGRRWSEGDYLPSVFWRYQVNDYRFYGLGYPPAGTMWVHVDNHIYLVDQQDGYIIEVIYDAWNW